MINQDLYNESPSYCHYFFNLIDGNDLLTELEKNLNDTLELMRSVPADKQQYAYQPGKWTVQQVFQHLVECERIFAYRALRFSRFDSTPLPGFEEDMYIDNSKGMQQSWEELIHEFELVRKSTIALFKTMSPEMLAFQSTANEVAYSTRALGFMIVGHGLHHTQFIKTTYFEK